MGEKHPTLLLSSVGLLVTLGFWATLTDPFNAPKSWILLITSTWLLGWVIFQIRGRIVNKTLKWSAIVAGIYFLAFFIVWLATDNKFQ